MWAVRDACSQNPHSLNQKLVNSNLALQTP